MSNSVEMTVKDGIALIRINRPDVLNALNREVVDELEKFIDQINSHPEIRAAVINGDRSFAAGADISSMVECGPKEVLELCFTDSFNKLESCRVPTIAAIEGFCLGGGFELALACDIRIMSEKAKVGFPEVNLGVIPGAGGTIRAARLAGEDVAKMLIYTGETISGETAYQYGFATKLVPKGEALQVAMDLATVIAGKAPLAVEHAKRSIQYGLNEYDRSSAVENEKKEFSALFVTEDQKEGMRAFLSKRTPVFSGK